MKQFMGGIHAHPTSVPDAASIPPTKYKGRPQGTAFVFWWSRRESNPRPQALYSKFYMRSLFI
jgi:hypothetical protein